MRQLVFAIFVFGMTAATSHAGLIMQQSGGTFAPGETVVYDLIFKNEPTAATAPGAPITIDAIGPVNFLAPVANSPGSPAPTYSLINNFPIAFNPVGLHPNTAAGWTMFGPLPPNDSLFQNPGVPVAPMGQETFATLSVDIPLGFFGSFDLILDKTIVIQGPNLPATGLDWTTQENPAYGASELPPPAPGGGPASPFTFTAVPEPSPFLLLGLVGLISVVRSRFRR